ncbi:hypothetical protein AB6C44_04350 [Vibrio splendidus]
MNCIIDRKVKAKPVSEVVELLDEVFEEWLAIKKNDDDFSSYVDRTANCAYPKGYVGVDADRVLWRDLKFATVYKRNLVMADCFYRVFYSDGANAYRTYVNREFADVLDRLFMEGVQCR